MVLTKDTTMVSAALLLGTSFLTISTQSHTIAPAYILGIPTRARPSAGFLLHRGYNRVTRDSAVRREARADVRPVYRTGSNEAFLTASHPRSGSASSTATAAGNSAGGSDVVSVRSAVLASLSPNTSSAAWTESYSPSDGSLYAFHALFRAIRKHAHRAMGWEGSPFLLGAKEVEGAIGQDLGGFMKCFTYDDLEQALVDDFLDAGKGTADKNRGWKMAAVSNPRGSSFASARMTSDDVVRALESGTVIFNAIGAHVPKLALPTLAACDASNVPCASNMYVTHAGQRTSAPPHTDRQDVVVVQSQGRKHWKVYSPPEGRYCADPYARGKGDDDLPVHKLEKEGGRLLLEVTLQSGDVLFIPAGFPHTTSTALKNESGDGEEEETSIHLTFNIDTHVWGMNYLNLRRSALRRAGVEDTALGQDGEEDSEYVGAVNLLPPRLREGLMTSLPPDFLREDSEGETSAVIVAKRLAELAREVDTTTATEAETAMGPEIWADAVTAVRTQATEILSIHRDMYLAAVDEGEIRSAEAAMTAHLEIDVEAEMTPERMQRLSLFRVQRFYEQIDNAKNGLRGWEKERASMSGGGIGGSVLSPDWEFTLPLKVGLSVEADLGGAFFPATVTSVKGDGSLFDVKFFDGDVGTGLERHMIKLLAPPPVEDDGSIIDGVDTSKMTKKELKKWKKKQGIK